MNKSEDVPKESLKQFQNLSNGPSTKRRKKKGIEMKDKRLGKFVKNDFVERKSLLDQINDDSGINKSPFKGILRLTMLVGLIYVLNSILRDQSMLPKASLKKEIKWVLKSWGYLIAYLHIGYAIQVG